DVLKAISLKQKWDLNDLRVQVRNVSELRVHNWVWEKEQFFCEIPLATGAAEAERGHRRGAAQGTEAEALRRPLLFLLNRAVPVLLRTITISKKTKKKREGTLFILSGLIVNAMQIQEFDEARKKFSNAKSLSSSQFFDQNKAVDVAAQATLSKFSGSSAISSAVHTLDFPRVLRLAKLSNNGAVLLCKNTSFSFSSLKWRNLLGGHGSSRDVYYVSLHPDFCFRMRTFSFGMRTLEFKSSTQIRIYISIIKSEGLEISQPALDPQLSERLCCGDFTTSSGDFS
ncbi:hypothetical protein HN873_039573, partial [Arachis hypogaea]